MDKRALYAVPAITILVVAVVVFGFGAPGPLVAARVYGGPTDGVTRLSWRVQRVERGRSTGVRQATLEIEVATRDGRHRRWVGPVDDYGDANVLLDVGAPPIHEPLNVSVTGEGRELARGAIDLPARRWLERARSRGGPLKARSHGALNVQVAPTGGVLALPFALPLSIAVTESGRPVPHARIAFAPEGLLILAPGRTDGWTTDLDGRLQLLIEPREHVVALGVVAETDAGKKGEFYSTLPVVPGALHASLLGHKLRVQAGVPLDRAYYAIQTERSRWAGGGLALHPDGRGGSVALVDVGELPPPPWWAVLSTDAELDSAATVGWPLGNDDGSTWSLARSVPDQLLLDGLEAARAAETRGRRHLLALALGLIATAALVSSCLLLGRIRSAQRTLAAHVARHAPEQQVAWLPSRGRSVLGAVVALVCLGLGFLLIALWLIARLG